MKFIKQCLISILIWFLVGLLLLVLAKVVTAPIIVNKAHAEKTQVIERDDVDRLIDQLAYCESRNDEKAINPRDPVTASLGLLQFKTDTFWRYNEIYKILPDLERTEVNNIIFDGETQRKLAKKIIKDGGWRNWYNCLKPYFL